LLPSPPPPILQIMILKRSPPQCVISKESVQQKWIDELWYRKQLSTCLNSWALADPPSQWACPLVYSNSAFLLQCSKVHNNCKKVWNKLCPLSPHHVSYSPHESCTRKAIFLLSTCIMYQESYLFTVHMNHVPGKLSFYCPHESCTRKAIVLLSTWIMYQESYLFTVHMNHVPGKLSFYCPHESCTRKAIFLLSTWIMYQESYLFTVHMNHVPGKLSFYCPHESCTRKAIFWSVTVSNKIVSY
jgi:hypothetical protein